MTTTSAASPTLEAVTRNVLMSTESTNMIARPSPAAVAIIVLQYLPNRLVDHFENVGGRPITRFVVSRITSSLMMKRGGGTESRRH